MRKPLTLGVVAHRAVWSCALLALFCAAPLWLALGATPATALSFAPAKHFPAGLGPAALDVADLNSDGKPDIVAVDGKGCSLRVLVGNGRGGFADTGPWATGAGPSSVAVADFDSDGMLDVVTGNGADGTVSVLFGEGLGGFTARADFIVGAPRLYAGLYPTGVAVGDFNSDGNPDVAACAHPMDKYPFSEAAVLLGDGAGGFAPRYGVPTPEVSSDIAVGDFNADGKQDLVAATVVVSEGDGTGAGVLLGDGSGRFSAMVVYRTHLEPHIVAVGDLNGDGRQDLTLTETLEGTGELEVLLGDGAGGFSLAPGGRVVVTNDEGAPSGVALADVNGDGRRDAVSALGTSALVLRGDGQGGLGKVTPFPVGRRVADVAAADFNRDGLQDIATADYAAGSVSVLLNKTPQPWVVTLTLSDDEISAGETVKYSGSVKTAAGANGAGTVTLQKRRLGSSWSNWRTKTLNASGEYSINVAMTTADREWEFRTRMPANSANQTGFSPMKTLIVLPPLG